ncbi:MAG: hypothetical protein WCP16_00390 [Pseudanabaena sp. ELA645]|jgi:uncharacterized protein (TIGR02646 family)
MKHIKKRQEPQSLNDRRNDPDTAKYKAQKDWQSQLLEEQGYICAYCMGRIRLNHKDGKAGMQIEHYISRQLSKERSLNLDLHWLNMLGVCNGKTGKKDHCDQSQGKTNEQGILVKGKVIGSVELNVLNPLDITKSERIITYSVFGDILPNTQDENLRQKIIEDLDYILNLNDEKLRDYRAEAIDLAKKNLKDKYPTGNWTLQQIENEIQDWKSKDKNGMYRPFCQAAIWWLEKKRAKLIHKS